MSCPGATFLPSGPATLLLPPAPSPPPSRPAPPMLPLTSCTTIQTKEKHIVTKTHTSSLCLVHHIDVEKGLASSPERADPTPTPPPPSLLLLTPYRPQTRLVTLRHIEIPLLACYHCAMTELDSHWTWHLLVEIKATPFCQSECVCVQAVQQDPRVTQLVKDLNKSIQAAAEDSGDSIPAVLVLNKVSMSFPNLRLLYQVFLPRA